MYTFTFEFTTPKFFNDVCFLCKSCIFIFKLFTIVNEVIVSRIRLLIEHYGLSISSFADTIGVQRSSMSHLLSGRNKPSLDFVLKLIKVYPDVDLYWLLFGKGSFPSEPKSAPSPTHDPLPESQKSISVDDKRIGQKSVQFKNDPDRIVLFYADGSFESFQLKNNRDA